MSPRSEKPRDAGGNTGSAATASCRRQPMRVSAGISARSALQALPRSEPARHEAVRLVLRSRDDAPSRCEVSLTSEKPATVRFDCPMDMREAEAGRAVRGPGPEANPGGAARGAALSPGATPIRAPSLDGRLASDERAFPRGTPRSIHSWRWRPRSGLPPSWSDIFFASLERPNRGARGRVQQRTI